MPAIWRWLVRNCLGISKLNSRQNWQIRIAVCVLAIFVFSLVGPYSTYERFPFGQRLLYWGALIAGFLLPAYWVRLFVQLVAFGSALQRDVLCLLVSGLILAPAIWLANRIFLGAATIGIGSLVEHLVLIWLFGAVPVLVRHFVRNISMEQPAPFIAPDDSQAGSHVPLLRHLEPDMRGSINRVSASDRLSIIHTEKGAASLRMRFADALIQLEGAKGMRVHRSHWVAFGAIERLEQDGRRYVATLTGGETVPVSPAYVDDLADAGVQLVRQ